MSRNGEKIEITTRMTATKSVVSALTTLVICVILFFMLQNTFAGNRYIAQVKGGHPYAYPNISYEDAFGKFYASPGWSYLKGNDGSNIVVFSGRCQYDGKPADVKLRFQLNPDNTFSLVGGSVNGVEYNLFLLSELNTKPFEEY